MRADRRHDVVLFGATGYTGRLAAEHLARHAGPRVRWALAGRDRGKLEATRRELADLAPGLAELPILVADGADAEALAALASSARVVATTVGPYRGRGEALVRACAAAGTHYCDITGELPFIRASIDELHAVAQARGARIVHACGFDAIPSDLGVRLLADHARATFGEGLASVRTAVRIQGRGSPGGLETALALISGRRHDRALRRLYADPYALTPGHAGPDGTDRRAVGFDRELREWLAPFPMAALDTRIVRRSAALLGYGDAFRYEEAMSMGGGAAGLARAVLFVAGLAGLALLASAPWTHGLLRRAAGASRGRGFFALRFLARTESGRTLTAQASGDGDPGCGPTAVMLAESALCLAGETPPGAPAGVLTPAAALGPRLVERLARHNLRIALDAQSAEPRTA